MLQWKQKNAEEKSQNKVLIILGTPTLALATKIVNVPKMILKPPLLASASGTVRIGRNQASALAITRLASVYPPLSELSGAYYTVGNIHEGEVKSQIHQQKGMASSDNDRQSPSDGKIIVQEQNVSGVTGHANVNIIVHNDFEKALPTEQLGGMRAGDKLTKKNNFICNQLRKNIKSFHSKTCYLDLSAFTLLKNMSKDTFSKHKKLQDVKCSIILTFALHGRIVKSCAGRTAANLNFLKDSTNLLTKNQSTYHLSFKITIIVNIVFLKTWILSYRLVISLSLLHRYFAIPEFIESYHKGAKTHINPLHLLIIRFFSELNPLPYPALIQKHWRCCRLEIVLRKEPGDIKIQLEFLIIEGKLKFYKFSILNKLNLSTLDKGNLIKLFSLLPFSYFAYLNRQSGKFNWSFLFSIWYFLFVPVKCTINPPPTDERTRSLLNSVNTFFLYKASQDDRMISKVLLSTRHFFAPLKAIKWQIGCFVDKICSAYIQN
ncbi:hypothetical protein EGR_00150 [Echinococcus granulosus]|uniref:Uncharacterized protein n=1 Tax=Echinococcus granulosus TaxID=6210 RepID=W6UW74_ECHGR|nr:hypothetical protein EGR_00150 [Echinococcus granulosus]EUB64881.1 hypothetical protein EGR_00150 [Echinococcus granulosus]